MLWVLPHVLFCPVVAVLVHQSCWCAGNGGAPQAAPAPHPNPPGHAADPHAVGGFTFAAPGANFGFLSFAGAAGADLPTNAFSFSGVDPFAGKWLQVALPPVTVDCACIVRQCSLIVCVLPVELPGSWRRAHHHQASLTA